MYILCGHVLFSAAVLASYLLCWDAPCHLFDTCASPLSPRIAKVSQKRRNIAQEMLSTEESYVQCLVVLVEVCSLLKAPFSTTARWLQLHTMSLT